MKSRLLLFFLLLPLCAGAQTTVVEKTYISTDREIYVSGDKIWCSAFCVDAANTLRPSSLSAIAYVEIVSEDGTLESGKIALSEGRGAGTIEIPATAPTGNYRIVAYTAYTKNTPGFNPQEHISKTISIFNTSTKERVKNGVKILSDSEYDALRTPAGTPASTPAGTPASTPAGTHTTGTHTTGTHSSSTYNAGTHTAAGALSITCHRSAEGYLEVVLTNNSATPADLSLSLSNRDGIIPPDNTSIGAFMGAAASAAQAAAGAESAAARASARAASAGAESAPAAAVSTAAELPEYEGEIIRGRIAGATTDEIEGLKGRSAFISVPTEKSDLYSSVVDNDGMIKFVTNNIYGTKEMVCEIEDNDLARCHIELISPFVSPKLKGIPALQMAPSIKEDLQRRGLSVQLCRSFSADTLASLMPIRENPLIPSYDAIEYKLDDYKRFPVMRELFIEFINEIKVRRVDGKEQLKVKTHLEERVSLFDKNNSLIMVDGIPIFDHSQVIEYDPLLVESVVVYPYKYYTGWRSFCGMANFVTYKKNLPGIKFNDGVRVVQFKGCSYPMAFTCQEIGEDFPDYRELLYWHPQIKLPAGESSAIKVKIPANVKEIRICAEGMMENGTPFSITL
ncbi:MAG: hypothetical protein SPH62_06745 [Candidatus Egerieousia sp.]|nr:hypothetical protein [bacterium]MDY5256080.1 hypothetical protein [Candidatus Egerieousia sp.]